MWLDFRACISTSTSVRTRGETDESNKLLTNRINKIYCNMMTFASLGWSHFKSSKSEYCTPNRWAKMDLLPLWLVREVSTVYGIHHCQATSPPHACMGFLPLSLCWDPSRYLVSLFLSSSFWCFPAFGCFHDHSRNLLIHLFTWCSGSFQKLLVMLFGLYKPA